jgi:glutamine synthetase
MAMVGSGAPVDLAARRAEVVALAERQGVRLVRFLYCDNDGIIRGKTCGASRLGERLAAGIGISVAMQAMTLRDELVPVEGMGPVGEIRLVPDPETFVIAPYAPHTGVVLTDMLTLDRRPYAADPRLFLRRMTDLLAARGLELVAAFEPEWTLVTPAGDREPELFDHSLGYSSHGMQGPAAVVDDLVGALEAQGLSVEQYHPELGGGQQELSIRHAPALRAADRHLLYRETVRAVTAAHGLAASFAPKPWPDQPGNGCHLHVSIWDGGGRNCFADPAQPHGLSKLGRSFLAGVLDHLPGLMALTCASVNSYRRLQPRMWSSAYRAWGPENREAAVRAIAGESTNVELKACDSSSNPYLALGGVIAAGLDGMERQLAPPPPLTVDPDSLSDAERAAAGATRHPRDLGEAIAALRADAVLMGALGEPLSASYIAVKESNIEQFGAEDETVGFNAHRFRY